MLVSHSHKLVFVHIQKTGGQTVSKILKENISDVSRFKRKHGFAVHAKDDLEGWNEYFKFAFVRNPWDRLVSWYSMIRNADQSRLAGMEQGKRQFLLWRYVLDNSSSFDEFIRNCTGEIEIKKGVFYSFTFNQLDYVSDQHGNLLVDFIGRFENFQSDLLEVSNRVGLELDSIPHRNRSPHKHYSSFYTPETEMIVRDTFKRDIEYFGYEFEDVERRA